MDEKDVKARFCYNCGEKVPDNSKFCMHCGAPVHEPISTNSISEQKEKTSGMQYPKRNLTNGKIIILILSAVSFIAFFIIPFAFVSKSDHLYYIWMTGQGDFPSFLDNRESGGIAVLFIFFHVPAILTIVGSTISEKITLCKVASFANIFVASLAAGEITNSLKSAAKTNETIAILPIGEAVQIVLAIAILVIVFKEAKKSRTRQNMNREISNPSDEVERL